SARLSARLPESWRGFALDTRMAPNDPLVFSEITGRGVWNPACQSPLLGTGEPDANSDRHNPDHPLPPLHGGNRLQVHDRPQGRAVRLPRLRSHGTPRRARVRVHLPPLLEAVAREAREHDLSGEVAGALLANPCAACGSASRTSSTSRSG